MSSRGEFPPPEIIEFLPNLACACRLVGRRPGLIAPDSPKPSPLPRLHLPLRPGAV